MATKLLANEMVRWKQHGHWKRYQVMFYQSRFATPLYNRGRGRGEMTLEPKKKSEDMFYEVFVKRK